MLEAKPSVIVEKRNRGATLFTGEFSSFFSLVRVVRSRFPLANAFYVSFVRKSFFREKVLYP